MKRWFVFVLSLALLAEAVLFTATVFFTGAVPVQAASASPESPPGFDLLSEQPGVRLYRKDYSNGTPDYVQVVDLGRGGALRLLYAPVSAKRPGRGAYGGSDAKLGLNSLEGYWRQAVSASSQVFCVTNGQFFYMPEAPTRLALPLKVGGAIITEGFGYAHYPEKLMLELWPDHAEISLLTAETLYASSAPDILGGLPEEANKRAPFAVGRTFIGIDDLDGDGQFESVYLLNTATASQGAAAKVLRKFAADKVMMLDGGGSTQLICQGESLIPSERNIPQAIAVLAAPPAPALDQASQAALAYLPLSFQVRAKAQTLPQAGLPAAVPIITSTIQIDPAATLPVTPEAESPSQPKGDSPSLPSSKPHLNDLLLIPLIMLPLFLILFLLLLKAEQ